MLFKYPFLMPKGLYRIPLFELYREYNMKWTKNLYHCNLIEGSELPTNLGPVHEEQHFIEEKNIHILTLNVIGIEEFWFSKSIFDNLFLFGTTNP